jgi:aromatic ring hydroxylase
VDTLADVCAERETLLDKVNAAVLAHAEASARLAKWIVAQNGVEERDHLRDEILELCAIAEAAWEEYRRHIASHHCAAPHLHLASVAAYS